MPLGRVLHVRAHGAARHALTAAQLGEAARQHGGGALVCQVVGQRAARHITPAVVGARNARLLTVPLVRADQRLYKGLVAVLAVDLHAEEAARAAVLLQQVPRQALLARSRRLAPAVVTAPPRSIERVRRLGLVGLFLLRRTCAAHDGGAPALILYVLAHVVPDHQRATALLAGHAAEVAVLGVLAQQVH